MLKLENSIRGLSFSRVAFDLTIQAKKLFSLRAGEGRKTLFIPYYVLELGE